MKMEKSKEQLMMFFDRGNDGLVEFIDKKCLGLGDINEWFYHEAYSIGGCVRELFYTMSNIPVSNPMTPDVIRKMESGQEMHEWIYKRAMRAGIHIQHEVPMKHKPLGISFRQDLFICWGGDKRPSNCEKREQDKCVGCQYAIPVEIKWKKHYNFQTKKDRICSICKSKMYWRYTDKAWMCNTHAFSEPEEVIVKKSVLDEPDLENYLQLQITLNAKGYDKGILMYGDYDERDIIYHWIHKDPNSWEFIQEKIKFVNECVAKNEAPDREYSKDAWQCRYCRHLNYCWNLIGM